MLLLTQALDETGGCLRFRTIMAGQPEAAVRREYRLAVGRYYQQGVERSGVDRRRRKLVRALRRAVWAVN